FSRDWSSEVCTSDVLAERHNAIREAQSRQNPNPPGILASPIYVHPTVWGKPRKGLPLASVKPPRWDLQNPGIVRRGRHRNATIVENYPDLYHGTCFP